MQEQNNLSSSRLRLIFMGTPEFASASLQALIDAGYHIVAVITSPDKPAGRGLKMTTSAVKRTAEENGLKVLQPEKLKNPVFIDELKSLQADLQVVVAFRMLPEVVWNMPPLGTINLHGSLLPQYRGAAPINWAIINGETQTGVTTFKLKHEIDTGNILMQESLSIDEEETAGDVHDRMKNIGAALLVKTVAGITEGTLVETPQPKGINESELKHAPKLDTNTCKIDWNSPVKQVHNLVRGLSPYPAAFTFLDNKLLKVYKTEIMESSAAIIAGEFETDGKSFIRFVASNGYVYLKEIQLEGKRKMKVEEFLRGYRF